MAVLDAEEEAVQAFVSHAQNCEALASDRPDAYRWRVVLLAMLGYAFPPAVLLALVGFFAAGIWIYAVNDFHGGGWLIGKLGVALLFLIVMVGRAMWPRFGAPDGIRLKRADAPEFFAFIDEIRGKAGNPKVHRLYVTDDLNAAVRQTPRLGFFGWHRNDLILGLPLLLALTKKETAAVIAHEFGHLSGAHGKLGAWIYRSRFLMARIQHAIEAKSYFGSWIFRRFYGWYEPFFAAYSFALAREQEYEADRMAAEAVSAQAAADALARSSVAADYIGGVFWGEVWDEAARQAEPPSLVYGRLGIALASLHKWGGSVDSFDANRGEITGYADTHPSLSDRARALDVEARLPPAISDAAAWLLPNDGAQLVLEFSEQWQAEVAEHWTERHAELQERIQHLAALDAAAENGALSEEDALERGYLAERFIDAEAALLRFEQALTWTDGAAAPMFQLGRILLNLGRDEGLVCLKQAMDADDDAIVPACELAEAYLNNAERGGETVDFVRRREAHQKILDEDSDDRHRIDRGDTLAAHDFDEEQLEPIMRVIGAARKKGLKRAWLVRKTTKHREWEAAYFLVCDVGGFTRWTEDMDELQTEMAEALAGHENVVVMICDVADAWLRTKASLVAHAQVFP